MKITSECLFARSAFTEQKLPKDCWPILQNLDEEEKKKQDEENAKIQEILPYHCKRDGILGFSITSSVTSVILIPIGALVGAALVATAKAAGVVAIGIIFGAIGGAFAALALGTVTGLIFYLHPSSGKNSAESELKLDRTRASRLKIKMDQIQKHKTPGCFLSDENQKQASAAYAQFQTAYCEYLKFTPQEKEEAK